MLPPWGVSQVNSNFICIAPIHNKSYLMILKCVGLGPHSFKFCQLGSRLYFTVTNLFQVLNVGWLEKVLAFKKKNLFRAVVSLWLLWCVFRVLRHPPAPPCPRLQGLSLSTEGVITIRICPQLARVCCSCTTVMLQRTWDPKLWVLAPRPSDT